MAMTKKIAIACPKCHQMGEVSSELWGEEVDCPKCYARFSPVDPRIERHVQRCLRCDSDKIIPSVPLADRYGDVAAFARQAEVAIQGAPNAWVFKDEVKGGIFLSICGECGHVELSVSNPGLLWAAYQRSIADTGGAANP